MVASSLSQLEAVFSEVSDPRKAIGVRHPFSGIVSLVFLGLLGRITEMAVVVRWANVHWDEDHRYTKRPGLTEAFASATNAALAVLRPIHPPGEALRATAERIQWRPSSASPASDSIRSADFAILLANTTGWQPSNPLQ